MRTIAAAGLVLVATAAAPALGQSLVGEWTATAHTPNGEVSETLSVTELEDGYAISAKLVIPPPQGVPEAGPGANIVLDGDRFSYTRFVGAGPTALAISYTGVVSGDTFTGAVNMAGFEVPYTGVRIPAGN